MLLNGVLSSVVWKKQKRNIISLLINHEGYSSNSIKRTIGFRPMNSYLSWKMQLCLFDVSSSSQCRLSHFPCGCLHRSQCNLGRKHLLASCSPFHSGLNRLEWQAIQGHPLETRNQPFYKSRWHISVALHSLDCIQNRNGFILFADMIHTVH